MSYKSYFVVACLLISPFAVADNKPVSFSNLSIGLNKTTLKNQNYSGFSLDINKAFGKHAYFTGSATSISSGSEFSDGQGDYGTLNLRTIEYGFGFHTNSSPKGAAFVDFKQGKATREVVSSKSKVSANIFGLGFKAKASEKAEFGFRVNFNNPNEGESGSEIILSSKFTTATNVSLGIDFESAEDYRNIVLRLILDANP